MGEITKSLKRAENIWRQIMQYINDELILKGNVPEEDPREMSLVTLVDKAHREWMQAKAYFEEVDDPDLVDHAIYAMEAAEKKYIYLLKLARKENVVDEKTYQAQQSGLV
jgi:hypothetical protein